MNRESWAEQKREQLEEDTLSYLISDEVAASDFLAFLDEKEPGAVQRGLNAWLDTREGREWFEETLERLIDERPEAEREDMPGSDR